MARFSGSITTTTGRSEAIRLDKALKAHPEFRQRARVRADVIGRGKMEPPLLATCDAVERCES